MFRYRKQSLIPNNAFVAKRMCIAAALFMMTFGFLTEKPGKIIRDLDIYMHSPDILVTDYFIVGSIGSAFVNAGLVMLITIGLAVLIKTPFNGALIAALFLISGFALFGKNPLNILPFFLGVWVYAKLHHQPMARYTTAAIYSSMLAPVVSAVMDIGSIIYPVRLTIAVIVGAAIAYILIPLAEHSFSTHMGYNLFNYGFAGGLIALVIASIVSAVGGDISTKNIWSRGIDTRVLALVVILASFLLLIGLWMCGWSFKLYARIMRHSGRAPTDFVLTDGVGPSMVNMGVIGLISLAYIIWIKGDLNGPVVGGILTSMGFAAAGEHPKNTLPIMVGVYIASHVMHPAVTDPGMQLAALFGTALAPISGQFGWHYGVLAGFIHAAVVLAVGAPTGGFNLYNNGFSAGLVALVMVAIIQGLSKGRAGERQRK